MVELFVEEINRRLEDLDAKEIEGVRAHETWHENRATLLERLDRSLA